MLIPSLMLNSFTDEEEGSRVGILPDDLVSLSLDIVL